jgi:hypothetical protein
MSWIVPQAWQKPAKPERPPKVTLLLTSTGQADAPPKFTVYLGRRVLAALGWTLGDSFALTVGSEAHAGWLRIAPAVKKQPDASVLRRKVKDSGAITFGRLLGVFGERIGKAAVPFVQDGDALEVAIPAAEAFQAGGKRPRQARRAAAGHEAAEGDAAVPPPTLALKGGPSRGSAGGAKQPLAAADGKASEDSVYRMAAWPTTCSSRPTPRRSARWRRTTACCSCGWSTGARRTRLILSRHGASRTRRRPSPG